MATGLVIATVTGSPKLLLPVSNTTQWGQTGKRHGKGASMTFANTSVIWVELAAVFVWFMYRMISTPVRTHRLAKPEPLKWAIEDLRRFRVLLIGMRVELHCAYDRLKSRWSMYERWEREEQA